jgi:hypothetical protein
MVASRPYYFTPEEIAHGTQWIGGWMGSRVGLNNAEKRIFLTHSKSNIPVTSNASTIFILVTYLWCINYSG